MTKCLKRRKNKVAFDSQVIWGFCQKDLCDPLDCFLWFWSEFGKQPRVPFLSWVYRLHPLWAHRREEADDMDQILFCTGGVELTVLRRNGGYNCRKYDCFLMLLWTCQQRNGAHHERGRNTSVDGWQWVDIGHNGIYFVSRLKVLWGNSLAFKKKYKYHNWKILLDLKSIVILYLCF